MPNLQKIIKVTQAQYDTLASGGTVGSYTGLNDNYLYLVPKEESSITPLTYAQLKTLRDNSQLVPGQQYRITDYACTTVQTDTSSAGHAFDIIVTADATNKLNETARAALHSGDTYFASNKLEAWQIWYCIDNDTDRFAWADATNGKGVIYRMIDEFNNDVPYDFKNILFTTSGQYTNAYTFTHTESSTIKDASLVGLNRRCSNNVIAAYITIKQQLNFNVFYVNDSAFHCYRNIFGPGCAFNTFSFNCNNNTFGSYCTNNTFGDSSSTNIFGNYCSDNIFGSNCGVNTFGNSCSHMTLGNYCSGTTFSANCTYITLGDSSSVINYCSKIIVDTSCRYLYINSTDTEASGGNYLQNVHVHLGVKGSSSSNRKTITVDRNLSYETNVYMDANGNIEMVVNSGIRNI